MNWHIQTFIFFNGGNVSRTASVVDDIGKGLGCCCVSASFGSCVNGGKWMRVFLRKCVINFEFPLTIKVRYCFFN
jgi:hypothetical protein